MIFDELVSKNADEANTSRSAEAPVAKFWNQMSVEEFEVQTWIAKIEIAQSYDVAGDASLIEDEINLINEVLEQCKKTSNDERHSSLLLNIRDDINS